MKNAGRAGIVPKDDFDINIKYKRLDAVMYDKRLYIAKKDVPLGTLPTDTTYWMKSIYGNKEPIATTETVGVVKPDGDTITVDEDGTLHGQSNVDEMTGATADADGTSGTVPVPKAGQEDLFLCGDGTWREAGTNITVDSELSKESTNPIENRAVAEELEKKINSDGDSKDLTTTFTSNDSTNVTEWTDVGVLTSGEKHSSLFQKVATMFKNIRYLYHMLGTADISTLGEGADIGTVTGALSKLNSDKSEKTGSLPCYTFSFGSYEGMVEGDEFANIKALHKANKNYFKMGSIIHIQRGTQYGYDTFFIGSTDADYFRILCISYYERPYFIKYDLNSGGWGEKQFIVTE